MESGAVDIASIGGGRSLGKACCLGCLLFVLALFIVGSLVIRVFIGPGTAQLSALPTNYPPEFTLYRMSAASSITYLAGQQKGRIANFLALPLQWTQSVTGYKASLDVYTKRLEKIDNLTVTWINLPDSRQEVLRYYSDLFQRTGMSAVTTYDGLTGTDSVSAKRADVSLQLLLQTATSTVGVDRLVITVDYVAR